LFVVVLLIFEKDHVMDWTRSEVFLLMAIVHVYNGISTLVSSCFIEKLPAHRVITLSVLYLSACYDLTAFTRRKGGCDSCTES